MVKKSYFKAITIVFAVIFSFSICIIPTQAKTTEVIIGGETFGLKLYCKGVMVLKLENYKSGDNLVCPAKDAGIQINDIITKANRFEIKSNEQFSNIIKASKGKPIKLTILRNNKETKTIIKPKKNNNNEYYTGMWIRDSCAGLGTISYYNPDNMTYGALGHGICDIDTGGLMLSDSGEIISAAITSVNKSKNNNIGTLNGYFTDIKIGTIKNNSIKGVYGKLSMTPNKKRFKAANITEIKLGNATMYSTINGEEPKGYKIKIIDICNNNPNSNRNMIIKITDKKLLNKTNGIVQGMSGSPIVQNSKFIGALTHVFIDDCTMGYAILATNMIND